LFFNLANKEGDFILKIKGLSIYKCNGGCEYHFAIEYGDFPDETEPTCCPICTSDNFTFVRDMNID
jgi:hypothetical protein